MLLVSIRHAAARLLKISGRDTRALFWPYAWTVIAFVAVVMVAALAKLMAQMQRFAAAHPDQSTVESGPGYYSLTIEGDTSELAPGFQTMFEQMGIVAGLAALLLATAVVRRLHDRGKSGFWALPPALFLGIGLILAPRLSGTFGSGHPPDMGLFFGLFLNNLLYLASLLYLVFLLATEGPRGANRFGPDPREQGS